MFAVCNYKFPFSFPTSDSAKKSAIRKCSRVKGVFSDNRPPPLRCPRHRGAAGIAANQYFCSKARREATELQ